MKKRLMQFTLALLALGAFAPPAHALPYNRPEPTIYFCWDDLETETTDTDWHLVDDGTYTLTHYVLQISTLADPCGKTVFDQSVGTHTKVGVEIGTNGTYLARVNPWGYNTATGDPQYPSELKLGEWNEVEVVNQDWDLNSGEDEDWNCYILTAPQALGMADWTGSNTTYKEIEKFDESPLAHDNLRKDEVEWLAVSSGSYSWHPLDQEYKPRLTFPVAHPFEVGDYIRVKGATAKHKVYNGKKKITSIVSPTVIEYDGDTAATNATGTITATFINNGEECVIERHIDTTDKTGNGCTASDVEHWEPFVIIRKPDHEHLFPGTGNTYRQCRSPIHTLDAADYLAKSGFTK